jgi:hypothetical protein
VRNRAVVAALPQGCHHGPINDGLNKMVGGARLKAESQRCKKKTACRVRLQKCSTSADKAAGIAEAVAVKK